MNEGGFDLRLWSSNSQEPWDSFANENMWSSHQCEVESPLGYIYNVLRKSSSLETSLSNLFPLNESFCRRSPKFLTRSRFSSGEDRHLMKTGCDNEIDEKLKTSLTKLRFNLLS